MKRTVIFGYEIKNGKLAIIQSEAQIVNKIFTLYVSGKSLKSIVDELQEMGAEYNHGDVHWSKMGVSRILDNTAYIGENEFPKIIPNEIYEQAKSIKNGRQVKQPELPDELEYLKHIIFCGECGGRYLRKGAYSAVLKNGKPRNKWLCNNGCKCATFTDDEFFEKTIFQTINSIKENPGVLDKITESKYQPTTEIVRDSNELIRIMEQPNINFSDAYKKILHNASERFDCCNYDMCSSTEAFKKELLSVLPIQNLSSDFMKKYIRRILIYPNGKTTIVFYNNAEVLMTGG